MSLDYATNDNTADQPDEQPSALKLLDILNSTNLVELLDQQKLGEISHKALDGYRLDDNSRDAWKKRTQAAMDLAMLLGEEKNYPFPGAANVKYPLLTTAALQFNARAYPAIVQGERVAKCKVNGHDQDNSKAARGERVSDHLSWQLTSEMPEWEEDTDRLLLIVSIVGGIFRKVYYDPTLGRKCSRLVTADRLVINYKSRSLEDVPRITEEMWLYPYEIQERINDGRFIDFEYGDAEPDPDSADAETDEDGPHKFIEQHRLLDLDGDDYPEPYIVTIHLRTEKICRIVPNFTAKGVRVTQDGKVAAIRRQDYYTKYIFMPSPDGGAYGMGLGWLLLGTNEAIDTTMNEMLDAGHMSNIQSGFISAAAGMKEKSFRMERGVFKVVNTGGLKITDAIMPMQFAGPSASLMALLQFLIEQGKEVSSTKDVLTGDTGGKVQQPTTVLALIEQGMKVFNAIFKRIHRAVKHELEMHARLNSEHLTPEQYNQYFDGPEQFDPKADYDMSDMNISPVSDSAVSTQMQRLAKSQVTREIAGPPGSKPWINYMEIDKRAFEAAEVPDIEGIFIAPQPPDPKQAAFMEAMQNMSLLELKTKIEKMEGEMVKDESASLLNVASAAAAEAGEQTNAYMTLLKVFQAEHQMEQDNAAGQGGVSGVDGQPNDQMGQGQAPPQGPGNGAAAAGNAPQLGGNQPAPVVGSPAEGSAPAGAM